MELLRACVRVEDLHERDYNQTLTIVYPWLSKEVMNGLISVLCLVNRLHDPILPTRCPAQFLDQVICFIRTEYSSSQSLGYFILPKEIPVRLQRYDDPQGQWLALHNDHWIWCLENAIHRIALKIDRNGHSLYRAN